MRMIVFGATGQTGQRFIEMALRNGHHMTAFVRNPDKMRTRHEHLNIITGSIFNQHDVDAAMQGQEAVISCLGGDANKKTTIITDMMIQIVDSMKRNQVKRIATIATAGIHEEIPGFITQLIIHLLFKHVIHDHRGAAEYIMSSDMDYTIARPLSLTDGELTTTYRTALSGIPKAGRQISRNDVAHFLLTSVENHRHIKASVGLAY